MAWPIALANGAVITTAHYNSIVAALATAQGAYNANGQDIANVHNLTITGTLTGPANFASNVGFGTQTNPAFAIDAAGPGLGSAVNSVWQAFRCFNASSNVDYISLAQVRVSAGTSWSTAKWTLQRTVDATLEGYIRWGQTGALSLGYGSTDAIIVSPALSVIIPSSLYIGTATPQTSGVSRFHHAGNTARVIDSPRTPASSSEACYLGEFFIDGGYLYIATANNTIKRVALSAF
jgi:hypothetical protein